MKTSKSQTPRSKQVPIIKIQISSLNSFFSIAQWDLDFVLSLEFEICPEGIHLENLFGAWNLAVGAF